MAWPSTIFADPQVDALALQQRAVERLNDLTETYRRTMDVGPLRTALALTESELTESAEALRMLGDDADLALSQVKLGDVWRLLNQPARAASLYAAAAATAARAGHASLQAQAWSAKAGEELVAGNVEQATRDAERAIPLAQASENHDALSRSYGTLTHVQVDRKNLPAAERYSQQEFAAIAKVSDRSATIRAYMTRALIRAAEVLQCDLGGDVAPCIEALNALLADAEEARAMAASLNYSALAKQLAEQAVGVEAMRTLLQSRGPGPR